MSKTARPAPGGRRPPGQLLAAASEPIAHSPPLAAHFGAKELDAQTSHHRKRHPPFGVAAPPTQGRTVSDSNRDPEKDQGR